jgi:hypothetical protein
LFEGIEKRHRAREGMVSGFGGIARCFPEV